MFANLLYHTTANLKTRQSEIILVAYLPNRYRCVTGFSQFLKDNL